MSESEIQNSLSQNRQIVLWALGGLIAICGLFYTHLRHNLDRDSNRTDRFSTAIAQIGHENLEVRLGGIYSLRRIAEDSSRDADTIVDVLGAFVRARRSLRITDDSDSIDADVNASINVLGRINSLATKSIIDLRHCNLVGVDLQGLDFRGALLASSDISNSRFTDCNFKKANLTMLEASRTEFRNCDFQKSQLNSSNVESAYFSDCNFSGTDTLYMRHTENQSEIFRKAKKYSGLQDYPDNFTFHYRLKSLLKNRLRRSLQVYEYIIAYCRGITETTNWRYCTIPLELEETLGLSEYDYLVPVEVYWRRLRSFPVNTPEEISIVYSLLIKNARTPETFSGRMHLEPLISVWPHLKIPRHLRHRWEIRFPQLAPDHTPPTQQNSTESERMLNNRQDN